MTLIVRRKRTVIMRIVIMLGMLFMATSGNVQAEEKSTENIVGFNYKVEYPENQLGTDKGFFDLLSEPGKEQTAIIVLSNPGLDKITVDVSLNGTKTNPNGVVEYGITDIENDESLQFPFEEIVSAPESVELAGGEVKNLEIKVKMPETTFDGIILGGIQLKKAGQEAESEEAQGATVRNEYAYIVAMVLKNSEQVMKPKIKVNRAGGAQRNYRNAVSINLSNTSSSLITNKMGIEVQVMKKGSQEVLYERKQTGMSISPNSQMDYYVSMNGERMVVGNYTAKVLATIKDQKWEKTLDFKITKEEADKYNKRDVGLVQDRGINWMLVVMIVGSILAIVIITFIIIRIVRESNAATSKKKSELKKSSRNRK